MSEVTWKCVCSVYDEPEKRFTPEGCGRYFKKYGGIDFDPFPFGVAVGDQLLGWPVSQCQDGKWRPEGIEECSFFLENATVQQLIVRGQVYVDSTTGHLRDPSTRYFAITKKEIWDGQECNQCGICCAFPRPKTTGGGACQFLQIATIDVPDRFEDVQKKGVEYAKKDKLKRYSGDGKAYILE